MEYQEEAGRFAYTNVIKDICDLRWGELSQDGLINVAWAYYYFSMHFKECMEVALRRYPDDASLQELDRGERNTDNLSPWPGVAGPGEKLDHAEFMRRTLTLTPIAEERRRVLEARGQSYLAKVRAVDEMVSVASLPSYEDGGLEAVFRSILKAQNWEGPLLEAFKHFLVGHVALDSDPAAGHGALCRHLTSDDRILPVWTAFRNILVEAAPELRA
jgi:hypothetical protein